MEPTTSDYARAWRWEEDGDRVAGALVAIDEGPLKSGELCPIAVLRVDDGGGERAVWLYHHALRAAFARELARRPSGDFEPGEPVEIVRGEEKLSENGRRYRDYVVRFPASPRRSARQILALDDAHPVDVEPEVLTTSDDVPF